MEHSNKIIWSIAANDNSGGAGLSMDIRVANALGVHLCPIVSGITAQNDQGVSEIQSVSPQILEAQLHSLWGAHKPAVIKLGLLPDVDIIDVVADFIKHKKIKVVADCPMVSSSGGELLSNDSIVSFKEKLLPHVALMTPNIQEAKRLLHNDESKEVSLKDLGKALVNSFDTSFLVKGGHSGDKVATDYFCSKDLSFFMKSDRLAKDVRGTGCALATAISCLFAKGLTTEDALVQAKAFLNQNFGETMHIGNKHYFRHIDYSPIIDTHLPEVTLKNESTSLNFAKVPEIGFYPIFDDIQWLKELLPLGIKTVQLRIKNKPESEIVEQVKVANQLCRAHNVQLFVNDYWQLAVELGCYGVHLGQEDMGDADLAAIANAGLRLGISTHSYYEAAVAKAIQPSYVALGPIFPTTCKSMAFGPQGITKVADWKRLFPNTPVVAIGGIQKAHARDILNSGADGIAVISDVTKAESPETSVKDWLTILKNYNKRVDI